MGRLIRMAAGTTPMPGWNPVVASAEHRAGVKLAMDTLPATEREALMLWNAGMDYREIAERTGQSSDAVGTFLTRARNRLVTAYDLLGV